MRFEAGAAGKVAEMVNGGGGAGQEGGKWVSVEFARRMLRRLNRSYRATPPEVLRRWWRGM